MGNFDKVLAAHLQRRNSSKEFLLHKHHARRVRIACSDVSVEEISGDLDVSDEIDVVALNENTVQIREADLVVDHSNVGGKSDDLELRKTEDSVFVVAEGEKVVVLLASSSGTSDGS